MKMTFRSILGLAFLLSLYFSMFTRTAHAQVPEPVTIQSTAMDFGLGGRYRPGQWTPLRLTIDSRLPDLREVTCHWILEDIDGDQILFRRDITLQVGQNRTWLYACPDVSSTSPVWSVVVVDRNSREVLASRRFAPQPQQRIRPYENALALVGVSGAGIGLNAYTNTIDTQHEKIQTVTLSREEDFPDRWQGYQMLESLIWTKSDLHPNRLSDVQQDALTQWVKQGGHLIIVMRTTGEVWQNSELDRQGLLPRVKAVLHTGRYIHQLPFLGVPSGSRANQSFTLDYFELQPIADSAVDTGVDGLTSPVSVIHKDRDGLPVVVGHQYGFGRVTLIGIDLTDRKLGSTNMPNGPDLWKRICGWHSPAYSRNYLEALRDAPVASGRLSRSDISDSVILGGGSDMAGGTSNRFKNAIAMSGTATVAVLGALFLFGLYWLCAGPITFAVLKQKNMLRHSWVAFGGIVLVFTVVAWGAAYVGRPAKTTIKHLTVLDSRADMPEVRVQSWMSLYVPTHGMVDVAIAPDAERFGPSGHLLSSAGMVNEGLASPFPDPQRYTITGASPDKTSIPFRSTTKQLEVRYLGPLREKDSLLKDKWVLPSTDLGGLKVSSRMRFPVPTGKLTHGLPGTLKNLFFVYCPGGGEVPWVFTHRQREWKPGEILALGQLYLEPAGGPSRLPKAPQRLVLDWDPRRVKTRTISKEGELGQIMMRNNSSVDMTQSMRMLSFYSMLPPPDYFEPTSTFSMNPRRHLLRPFGRELDLTCGTLTRQLILIAELDDSSLPIPISVEGRSIPSSGKTFVRWMCPVELTDEAVTDVNFEPPAKPDE